MKNPEKPTSWWQTTAGIMTGVAALLAAMTGLIHESCGPRGPIPPEVKSQMEALTTGHNQRLAELQKALIDKREQKMRECRQYPSHAEETCNSNYNEQLADLEKYLKTENDSYENNLNTLRAVR
jgi:hypothetical protein